MISLIVICKEISSDLIRLVKSVNNNYQIIIDVSHLTTPSLGARKRKLVDISSNNWILILDSDEYPSRSLISEIDKLDLLDKRFSAYRIPYLNYAFGGKVIFGGESFKKCRLINKSICNVSEDVIHEEIICLGKIGTLNHQIVHNSYPKIQYVIIKFSRYAWLVAGQKRFAGERTTLKKLFMYGPHMVWARAIQDEGWRDGWRGILLALCFGYMESLTYWLLLWRTVIRK